MTALLSPELWRMVEDHVTSDVEREVGGVLVGELSGDDPLVSGVIPALAAVGSTANVTFTQEVWEDVHQRIDRDHQGCQIVGWYHSHPGFGIFLSAYDLFIHENFFPAAGHVALVVDPLAGEAGWFGWRDGSVVEVERFAARTVAGRGQAAKVEAAYHDGQRPWRRLALLGLPVAVIAGFVAGQVVTSGVDPVTDDPVAVTESDDADRAGDAADDAADDAAGDAADDAIGPDDDLRIARSRVAELEGELAALEDERAPAPRETSVGQPQDLAYTVGAGDTLWRIAERLYGRGDAWPQIAAANPGLEPTALAVGSRLRIPLSDEQLIEAEASDDGDDAD